MSNAVGGSAVNEEVGLVLENVHHIALGLRQIDPIGISQDQWAVGSGQIETVLFAAAAALWNLRIRLIQPLKTATPVRSQLLSTLLRFSLPLLPWLCAYAQRFPSMGPPSLPKFPYTSSHQRPGMIIGTTR